MISNKIIHLLCQFHVNLQTLKSFLKFVFMKWSQQRSLILSTFSRHVNTLLSEKTSRQSWSEQKHLKNRNLCKITRKLSKFSATLLQSIIVENDRIFSNPQVCGVQNMLTYIQLWDFYYGQKPYYEAKCWFSRGHITSLEYCQTFVFPITFTH